jgi:hypothetical protein
LDQSFFIVRAGTPTATTFGGISWFTKLQAPITDFSEIFGYTLSKHQFRRSSHSVTIYRKWPATLTAGKPKAEIEVPHAKMSPGLYCRKRRRKTPFAGKRYVPCSNISLKPRKSSQGDTGELPVSAFQDGEFDFFFYKIALLDFVE